jgi:ABC-type Mn2+/Zn2+ transport system ATPase subunit
VAEYEKKIVSLHAKAYKADFSRDSGNMVLELHNITIGQQIRGLSVTVGDGKVLSITGSQGVGKTTLLRALLGFVAVDEGHISIDGELLTPRSAPWFRRQMAYVPQHLEVPEGYDKVPTDYMALLEHAVQSDNKLLIIDEPREVLSNDDNERRERLIGEAAGRGATVVAVNTSITPNRIEL